MKDRNKTNTESKFEYRDSTSVNIEKLYPYHKIIQKIVRKGGDRDKIRLEIRF